MEKPQIIVVDDEPTVRAFVQEVASLCGCKADAAPDAEAAIRAMEKGQYALAICDFKMPGKNGLWFLKEAKKRFSATRVIMLTASGGLQDASKCIELGAEKYLLKPIKVEELTGAIREAIGEGKEARR